MVVEKGLITWEDREPTPDPEVVNREILSRIETKLEDLANNQVKLLEEVARLKEGKGKGPKNPKAKKATYNTNKD